MFLFVGNKNLFGKGGISVFRYAETEDTLVFLGTQHTDISARRDLSRGLFAKIGQIDYVYA